MPPRPSPLRALHLPAKPPRPSTFKHPKPHLAAYHLQQKESPAEPSWAVHSLPPRSPQLPPRRQPAFSPGGFGLHIQPSTSRKGKEKAVQEADASPLQANKEESEASYEVSGRSNGISLSHTDAGYSPHQQP